MDEIQFEGGAKALWNFFYQLKTADLLEKYPKTSTRTVQLAIRALQDFNSYERTSLAPETGGRDQQTVEWVTGLDACYAAQAKADEDRDIAKLIEDAEADMGKDPDGVDFDEK